MYVFFDVGPLIIAHHSTIYINIIYKNQFAKFNCNMHNCTLIILLAQNLQLMCQ